MLGVDLFDPETMWLNLTNIALGVVTLACFMAVAWGVAVEVLERAGRSVGLVRESDDHSFAVPGLGITMADGGKKIDEESKQ